MRGPLSTSGQCSTGMAASPFAATSPARSTWSSATTCARRRIPLAAAFIEGATLAGRRRHRRRPVLDRPRLLRVRSARRAGRDVHREPQPGAVQRHQAVPRGCGAGRRADRACSRSRRWSRPGVTSRGEVAGKVEQRRPARRRSATTCARSSTSSVLLPLQGRRRHRERHGRARRAEGVRRSAVLADGAVRRARRHVPEPSRPIRSSPRT